MMNTATTATLLTGNTNASLSAMSGLASGSLGSAGKSMSADQADKTSKDFESMFLSQMLDQMFSGDTMGSEAFGDAETSEIYKGLMVDQFGKEITQAGGIGIAGYVKRELLKLQEV